MSVQPLEDMRSDPDHAASVQDSGASFRDELLLDVRRAAFAHGVDRVRVRALMEAVEQATHALQARAAFAGVVRALRDSLEMLFPGSPPLARNLLERAVGVLMVASIHARGDLGAQVLDHVLRDAAGSGAPGTPVPLPVDPVLDAFERAHALRREVDADPVLQALFSTVTTGVCLVSPEGVMIRANARYRDILGIDVGDVLGSTRHDLHHGRLMYTDAQHADVQRHASFREAHLVHDVLVHRPDGLLGWVTIDSMLIQEADGTPRYFLSLLHDITHRRAMPQAISSGDERLHALVQNTSGISGIISEQGRLEYVSESIERVLGYPSDSLYGMDFLTLTDAAGQDALAAGFQAACNRPFEPARVGASMRHADGSMRWMEVDFTRVDDNDVVSGVVFHARDITARKAVEEQLERLAYYDHLTTLPNRIQFREQLDEALEEAALSGETVGVIFIDIDSFKAINDRYGHDGGDAVLTAVGRRLTTAVRGTDLASRFGGDEFLILLRKTSPKRALRSAERVIQAIATADPGHPLDEPIALSAGVAIWSPEMQSSRDLLRAADVALYQSKARGGNVATLYDPGVAAYGDALVAGEG